MTSLLKSILLSGVSELETRMSMAPNLIAYVSFSMNPETGTPAEPPYTVKTLSSPEG